MSDPAESDNSWAQGDVCKDIVELPVLVSSDGDAEFVEVQGVVVVTQTCDLLRDRESRPRFQVAGLVQATPEEIETIRRFGKPQFVYVPQVADQGLVGDLDLIVSFDKNVLPNWGRLSASNDPIERREFGYALGRHRTRTAFPDRWSAELGPLRSWLRSRSGKESPEGKFARSIEQMRIIANDCDCPPEAHIICLIPETTTHATRSVWVAEMIPKLEGKINESWGCKVTFALVTISEITARDYLNSLRLDFDALSRAA